MRQLLIMVLLFAGGLAFTAVLLSALENRAQRPVDQAYSPTKEATTNNLGWYLVPPAPGKAGDI